MGLGTPQADVGRVELGESGGLVDLHQTGHPRLVHVGLRVVEQRGWDHCGGHDRKERAGCVLHCPQCCNISVHGKFFSCIEIPLFLFCTTQTKQNTNSFLPGGHLCCRMHCPLALRPVYVLGMSWVQAIHSVLRECSTSLSCLQVRHVLIYGISIIQSPEL